jgi:hypothetical protein
LENHKVLQMMKEMIPDRVPITSQSEFEHGVLAGYQLMYDNIYQRLHAQDVNKDTKDK